MWYNDPFSQRNNATKRAWVGDWVGQNLKKGGG